IWDATVVGVPDERWGQRVGAVVQLREGRNITLAELQSHCRQKIAGYKVPRQLNLVGEVVRSQRAKPDYKWALDVATRTPPDDLASPSGAESDAESGAVGGPPGG